MSNNFGEHAAIVAYRDDIVRNDMPQEEEVLAFMLGLMAWFYSWMWLWTL